MSKHLSMETAWRERTASFATHASKRGINLLGWDKIEEETMSIVQERDALVLRSKQISAVFAKRKPMSAEKRKELADEFNAINARINAIRPRLRGLMRGVEYFLIEQLRPDYTDAQWKLHYEAAMRAFAKFHRERVENGTAVND